MGKLSINVKIQDAEEVKQVIISAIKLVEQIDINDYEDKLGHSMNMNKAYIDLKEALANL